MNPRLIAVVAGAAAIAGIVLYVFVRNSGSSRSTGSSPRTSGSAVVVATDPATPAAPSLPSTPGQSDPAASGSAFPTDYVVGDIRVRDHRGGNNKPLDVPPNVHPAEHRELPSALTSSLSHEIKLVFYACGADVPKDARGAKPKLEGQMTTSIKDHKLVVTGMVAQIRDVNAPYQDAVKACVEQKAVGASVSASDQEDITDYGIQVSFALP
jgi:hypothetical protein